jgi:putative ABC transport system permease protein
MLAFFLAFKEVWRNRGRFLLFSLVIALITILVLFIAALAGGLATANKQFIEKLEADLLVFQADVNLQISASRLDKATLRDLRRVEGIAAAGPIGLSTAALVFADGRESVDISLVGVEPGLPGDPALLSGPGLRSNRKNEALIDITLARQEGLGIGDSLTVKSIQGAQDEFYRLRVVGITDERRYFFQPTLFVPLNVWDEIRPQATRGAAKDAGVIANLIAVQLDDPAQAGARSAALPARVKGIEAADKQSTILALPGYTAQQSTLNTQQVFTLLIGVLVVGGFFQIQTLQKVAQIGVLKAIGSPNLTVALAALLQIILVTVAGVLLGSLGTLGLSLGLPENIPILFNGPTVLTAIAALLLIGPLGGLVSIRLALKVDPLTAIGLTS